MVVTTGLGGIGTIQKSESVIITKKLARSGGGLSLFIPKDIIELLTLDENSMIEASLKKVVRAAVVVGGEMVQK